MSMHVTMNSTVSPNGPAQASETPFNISDYVNFDFDFETPHENTDAPSNTSVAQPFQSKAMLDPYVGFVDAVDTDFASTFQLLADGNTLGNSVNATRPTSEDLAMNDAFQTAIETGTSLDDFTVFEPTIFAQDIEPAALETRHPPSKLVRLPAHVSANPQLPTSSPILKQPSIWVPVSPQLQQHLNTMYASEIVQQRETSSPAPVLYFPAEEPCAYSTYSIQSLPNKVHTQYEIQQTPEPEREATPISPSLMMRESTAPSSQDPFPSGMHSPNPPTTECDAPHAKDPIPTLIKKHTLDASEPDSESSQKRTKIAQAGTLATVAMDGDSDNYDEPVITRKNIARQNPLPIAAEDDDSDGESEDDSENESENDYNDRSCNTNTSGSSAAPSSQLPSPIPVIQKGPSADSPAYQTPRKRPNWRYEQAQEVCLREQRRREWNLRRADTLSANVKAPNRKLQKLLKEIEDSEEFAEAQGFKVGEKMESDKDQGAVRRRPVRRGARKSYVGQE